MAKLTYSCGVYRAICDILLKTVCDLHFPEICVFILLLTNEIYCCNVRIASYAALS
jgi:hypothetical protein